eukprot:8412925-Alexandrium_andersonii.AAC.1
MWGSQRHVQLRSGEAHFQAATASVAILAQAADRLISPNLLLSGRGVGLSWSWAEARAAFSPWLTASRFRGPVDSCHHL